MPIAPEDLSPELQALLDTEAPEGACPSEQPVCTPDVRVTAQLVSAAPVEQTLPWRIAGTQKGDLLLSPGGPKGIVGGLLSQLVPPQLFSHISIFTRDERELRHCTLVQDWLNDHAEGGGHPTDGFQEDALRHGWPGTVTQSVEEAYLNTILPKEQQIKRDGYAIDAIGFEPSLIRVEARDEDFTVVWPVVVTCCPERPEVRDALHRIADAALDLRGHYRFFSYSKADIALDPSFAGPRRAELSEPDPTSPCAGLKPQQPVRRTLPLVCSTFIWTAVQEANRRGGAQIVLDGRRGEPVRAPCPPARAPQPRPSPQPPGTPDGLYHYSEDERTRCAKWLARYLHQKVWLEEAASAGLLTPIYEAFSDIADDVANQITNAFASDDCTTAATDSEAWKHPGEGVTVSPDDILNNWTAPRVDDPTDRITGVYGHSVPLALRSPEWTSLAPAGSTWQISRGPARVHGRVELLLTDGTRTAAVGAHVRVGCRRWMTDARGRFIGIEGRVEVPSGVYWSACWWRDPDTGAVLEAKGRPITLAVGDDQELNFVIAPPPVRRRVWLGGRLDLVNRYAIGRDWWDHPAVLTRPALLTWGRWPTTAEQDRAATGTTGRGWAVDDWGSCEITCTAKVDRTGALIAHLTARLREDDDNDPLQFDQLVTVPPKAHPDDPGVPITFDMVRSPDTWPVRAHCEIIINNDPAP